VYYQEFRPKILFEHRRLEKPVPVKELTMKIPATTFFNFCAAHVSLLRALMEEAGEVSEADVRSHIRATAIPEESPETVWRRLTELQILIRVEHERDFYFMADPVKRLLSYLFDEATATTPELIAGYIDSIETLDKQLSRATGDEDITGIRLALEELQQTLQRVQSDLEETQRCILAEVARYKIERQGVSIREKFRRIAYWMDRYIEPLVNIVRPDGPLRAAFDETERLLYRAREAGVYNDLSGLDRHSRHLRVIQRQALRVFQQCRRELQPLYESLRRASFIAEGSAIALERFQREGVNASSELCVVSIFTLRWQNAPAEATLQRVLQNVREYEPESAPLLALAVEEPVPENYQRRIWLDNLSDTARSHLPIDDIFCWLISNNPGRDTDSILAGFTFLIFEPGLVSRFTEQASREYHTIDGIIEAQPVHLEQV
jgi:hypothetical protein